MGMDGGVGVITAAVTIAVMFACFIHGQITVVAPLVLGFSLAAVLVTTVMMTVQRLLITLAVAITTQTERGARKAVASEWILADTRA